VVNDKLVFKKGNYSITIGDHRDVEEDDATKEEEDDEEEEGEGEEDAEEEDGLPASGQSGQDDIGTKRAIPTLETQEGVDSNLPILKVFELF
jgi:hypothetical protein